MMDLLLATSGGEAQAASGGYVDDVFSAYVRTGTGADVTVNTNIDMTKGYMLWTKGRSGATDHAIYDSARGVTFDLASNLTSAQTTQSTGLKSVSGTGHTIGSLAKMNTNAATYVDWVFRKAPKFFDVVTYTGNGVAGRQIPHSLGVAPGMAIVKRIDSASDWFVWHRSTSINALTLNTTSAAGSSGSGEFPLTQSADFFITGAAGGGNTNASNATYVAYLFAHDPSAEGIIQCGSISSGQTTLTLGWEPQYILYKRIDSTGDWFTEDTIRGLTVGNRRNLNSLSANTSAAEQTGGPYNLLFGVTSTGATLLSGFVGTYIYLAIRRPNKPPTSGTQVYNAIARTGTGAAATVTGVGFAPDLATSMDRGGAYSSAWCDRLRGGNRNLRPNTNGAEDVSSDSLMSFDMNGITLGTDVTSGSFNCSNLQVINHFFRRAVGFFDVVCDTGTGVAHAIAHNLTKAPELIIRKSRSAATQWEVWHSALAATEKLVLNSTAAKATDATAWNSTLPTSTQFTVGTGANVNTNAATYVTYLFATLAGISKVGSYTGNGTSQTINCGFSAGARFFLVKATSTTGNWWVFDSARGIVSSFDPSLALNSTAAEVTSADAVDPDPYGIIVNQEATCSINATGVNYVFLAIA